MQIERGYHLAQLKFPRRLKETPRQNAAPAGDGLGHFPVPKEWLPEGQTPLPACSCLQPPVLPSQATQGLCRCLAGVSDCQIRAMRLLLLPPPCICLAGPLPSGTPPAPLSASPAVTHACTFPQTLTLDRCGAGKEQTEISRPSRPATTHMLSRLASIYHFHTFLSHLPSSALPLLYCLNHGLLALFRIFLRCHSHLPSLYTWLSLTFLFLTPFFHTFLYLSRSYPLSLSSVTGHFNTCLYLIYASQLTLPDSLSKKKRYFCIISLRRISKVESSFYSYLHLQV